MTKTKTINFQAKADGGHVELTMYDAIGSDGCGGGITPQMVSNALKNHSNSNVMVYINSPGGSAFDGIAIHNVLRNHMGKVTTVVQGIAASAASLIAMAGDTIQMNESAMLMMHDASGLTYGNAEDHRKMMGTLDKLDASIATIYATKTGHDPETIREMMDEETWMTAAEALADGYANEMIVASIPANSFDLSNFKNVPQNVVEQFGLRENPTTPPETDTMTPEQFRAKHENAVNDWINEGEIAGYGQAKTDLTAMLEACGGDKAAAFQAFVDGKTVQAAKDERASTLAEKLAEAEARATAAENRAKELENGADPAKLDAAASVENDEPAEEDEKKAKVFKNAQKMEPYARNAYLHSVGYSPSDFDFDSE